MASNRYHPKENKNVELDKNPSKTTPIPFFENGYCKGKETRHGFMFFNPKDLHGQTLDNYGEMAYSEIELLNQLIKPGDVVLDVGANIGTHTLSFAKSVQSNGLVYAFEPQRLAFEFLCANIVLNNFLNVFPMMVGVSDESGEIVVPVLNPYIVQNAGTLNIEGHTAGDPIRLVTIDSLKLRGCNLIKIDVEGMERKVLMGAKLTVNKFRPVIFVENNNPGNSESVIQLMFELNYNCYWTFTEYLNRMDMNRNIFKPGEGFRPEVNMLCLPAERKSNVIGYQPVLDVDDTGEKAMSRLQGKIKPS